MAETVDLVTAYVRQETLGPLRGAGRWIAFGLSAALLLGIGTVFVALGVLRLLQTEWPEVFAGRWMSLLPHTVALVVCLAAAALALSRVSTRPLQEDR